MQRIFPQWEIVRFLNSRVPWPFPADGVLAFYRDVSLPAIERGEEWHWTFRPKTCPGQVIGGITLTKSEKGNRGFWLAPAWQNLGLMTEAVMATNDYWFDVLGFKVSVRRRPSSGAVRNWACYRDDADRIKGVTF